MRRIWWVAPVILVIGMAITCENRQAIDKCTSILKAGTAALEEGVVDRFDVRPKTGHKLGVISVNNKEFWYEDYDLTQALWEAAEPRGILREGCFVRLWHVGEKILKLDVLSNCEPQAYPAKLKN